jgi:hypothetical protein
MAAPRTASTTRSPTKSKEHRRQPTSAERRHKGSKDSAARRTSWRIQNLDHLIITAHGVQYRPLSSNNLQREYDAEKNSGAQRDDARSAPSIVALSESFSLSHNLGYFSHVYIWGRYLRELFVAS